jgi:SAM-dependent methyltransferase/CBS domain-containing protein
VADAQTAIDRTPVHEVMSASFNVAHAAEPVRDVAYRMLTSGIPVIPVVDDGGHLQAVIGYEDIVSRFVYEGDVAHAKVGQLEGRWVAVDEDAGLEQAARMIAETGVQPLPVVGGDSTVVGTLAHFDVVAHRGLRGLGLTTADLDTTISPQDAMWSKQWGPYLLAGVSAVTCIRKAMQEQEGEQVTRILDLGCGHGRVLRVLKASFPNAALVACDLDRDAVDFCAATFGATAVYSDADPSKVRLEESFDLIWSGSMFTHLDQRAWVGFFDLAVRSLTPGGLFVFTTSGRRDRKAWRFINLSSPKIDRLLADYDREGFGYAAFRVGPNAGLTAVSPEWVRSRADDQPDLSFVMHLNEGWEPPAPRQDVYACRRER